MTITGLADLLDLQGLDLDIDRLLDRRQGLPELEERRIVQEEIDGLDAERSEAADRLRSLELDLDKSEGELEMLETKLKEHETRLFAGGMSARETEFMRLEVQSLRGQDEALELRVIQMLEDVEPVREEVAALDTRIANAVARREELDSMIAGEWKVIDAELARLEAAKKTVAEPIDPELLDLYEKLRRLKEGVAIAVFDHGVCGGCHMALSPSEQEQALAEEMPRCVHCRRILVA
ncbi:MAG: C4-type zinc ribbon domain-containing protein [Actinobacteria bacterium]|nr:C4-type zinc ribbon domain-containing protein [Actinomycetota bacterium]MCI0543703.1 C4-type zinc ribbon domain-containing protein [Actinomycetota bacterium]MCI0678282.1 C4-type zinc ribbon domain-containing protein [Actinomycetota bacterium]